MMVQLSLAPSPTSVARALVLACTHAVFDKVVYFPLALSDVPMKRGSATLYVAAVLSYVLLAHTITSAATGNWTTHAAYGAFVAVPVYVTFNACAMWFPAMGWTLSRGAVDTVVGLCACAALGGVDGAVLRRWMS